MKFLDTNIKITIAYNHSFPLDYDVLDDKFQKKGLKKVETPLLKVSRNGRRSIAMGWDLQDNSVHYDPETGFLSIEGINVESVVKDFEELYKLVLDLPKDAVSSSIKWAELLFGTRVSGDKKPLETFSSTIHSDFLNKMTKMLGEEITPFNINFCLSSSKEEDQPLNKIPDWLHFQIEPFVVNPRFYFIRIVYRKTNTKEVQNFSAQILDRLSEIFKTIESEKL